MPDSGRHATIAPDMVVRGEGEFKLRTAAYTQPAVFEREMSTIFESTWIYVGHASEIPNKGDFITATLGLRPVIVVRGDADQLRVFLNVCRHRGSTLVREQRGNAKVFSCPYHGWVYRTDGQLAGVSLREGYPEGFDQQAGPLIQAPRVAVYRGLIFACMKANVEPLAHYLGWVAHYIDLWADMSPAGSMQARRPQRTKYQGNWKFQAENGYDGYHPGFVHRSAFSTFAQFGIRSVSESNFFTDAGRTRAGSAGGHGLLEAGRIVRTGPEQYAAFRQQLVDSHGEARAEQVLLRRHILVFPNLYLFNDHIRVVHPVSVSQTQVDYYFMALEGVPPAINAARLRDYQARLSPAGMVAPDDLEIFAGCQDGMGAAQDEWIHLSRGMQRGTTRGDAEREGDGTDETPHRAFYTEWLRCLQGEAGREASQT